MRLKFLFLSALFSLLFFFANAKDKDTSAIVHEKKCTAKRFTLTPKIDGLPDDECWKNIPSIHLNYQFEPVPGNSPTETTEIKLGYDDNAIYALAICYDAHIDSMYHPLTARGNLFKQTENIYLFFDTYHDGQNAYGFGVSVDNVQDDIKCTDAGNEVDNSWDAVWESRTSIQKNCWCVEYKIPYSAIRFPKKKIQDWTCDFSREIRHKRETTSWCTTPPTTAAFVPTMQPIEGIENIQPPLRLSFSPYGSAYLLAQGGETAQALKAGADIKYGINESFTLDMTLVPDFGQVVSDKVVKNLTPYEIQYQENRPFFLEGAELFSKNNLYYSRRIGETSDYFDNNKSYQSLTVSNIPTQTNLLNAFKLSGKSKNNLSIGLFNAITNNLYTTAVDSTNHSQKILVEPLTNYNIFVVDKTIANNSHIGFINTNVTRTQHGNNANVSGAEIKLLNKKNTYEFNTNYSISNIFNKNTIDGSTFKMLTGSNLTAFISKITGKWQGSYVLEMISPKFNSNDLGYLEKNNFITHTFSLEQKITKPFGKILKMENDLVLQQENHFDGNQFSKQTVYVTSDIDWKNYLTMVTTFGTNPTISKDFYDPRVVGRFVNIPKAYQGTIFFSSDYRKTYALDARFDYSWFDENHRDRFNFMLSNRVRVNKKILLNYTFSSVQTNNGKGFTQIDGDAIYFGKRNVQEIANSFWLKYVFNNKMSMNVTARHYWSGGRYSEYYLLQQDGNLQTINQDLKANFDFNAWTLDWVYTWYFAPGSQISFAWKNLIYTSPTGLPFAYQNNFNYTFSQPLANSFSVKVLYYVDAGKWRKHKPKVN